jgi:hypothetical protein
MFRVDRSRYEDPRLRVFRNLREQVGGDVHNLALRVRAVERSLLNAATALIRSRAMIAPTARSTAMIEGGSNASSSGAC